MANVTGLITVNEKQVLEVDADPSAGAGTPAPIGSIAMYDSGVVGQLYLKTGAADTAWQLVDTSANDWSLAGNALTGGSPDAPNEFFGSTNDFDVITRRNNIEQMRVINNAFLIGLSATIGGRLQIATDGAAGMSTVLTPGANQVIMATRMFRTTTVSNATSTFDIAVPTDTTVLIETMINARQTAGAAGAVGDSAQYVRTVSAKNVGGVVTKLREQNDYTYEVVPQFNATSAVSGTNIQYTVVGVTNRDVSWGVHSRLLITAG